MNVPNLSKLGIAFIKTHLIVHISEGTFQHTNFVWAHVLGISCKVHNHGREYHFGFFVNVADIIFDLRGPNDGGGWMGPRYSRVLVLQGEGRCLIAPSMVIIPILQQGPIVQKGSSRQHGCLLKGRIVQQCCRTMGFFTGTRSPIGHGH